MASGAGVGGAGGGALVMNDVRGTQDRPRRRLQACALWGAALIGVAVVLYVIAAGVFKPAGDLKSLARGDMAALVVSARPAAPPPTPFLDPQGRTVRLQDFEGRVMVVNLWATWCAPCVKEMPTLARLQADYPGRVRVIPISMDEIHDRERARAFIAEHPPLAFYQDPASALAFALDPAVESFPTTLIYDAGGHERARLAGAADWSGADARAVVESVLAHR
jgi:thiol-disulfide isomerase/thioredoxin